MRVTDRMIFDRAAVDGAAARSRAEEAVARASSGLRLQHPGDDPAGAGLVTLEGAVATRASAIGAAAAAAGDELGAVDGALGDITNALARARELATQFSTSTYSAQQRADAAGEVKGLLATIVASLDTQVGGRYVFGGTLDGTPPFDAAGSYAGDGGVRQVEVAPGVWQDASVRADVALKGLGGGTDVLATLTQLAADLTGDNLPGIQASLTGLATGTDQVASARQQAGNAMAAFDAAVSVNRAAHDEAVTRSAHLTDADLIQAGTDLAAAQRALQASLTATSQSFGLSLLDYLK